MGTPARNMPSRLPVALSLIIAAMLIGIGVVAATVMGAPLVPTAIVALAGIGGSFAVIAVMAERSIMPAPAQQTAAAPPAADISSQPTTGIAAIIDRLDFPLMLVHQERITTANRAATDLLGRFILGADLRTAIRHPAVSDQLANAPTDGAPASPITLVGVGRPGELWEMRVFSLDDGDRLVILTDRTGREAMERMRVDFVANASHELRTPLAAILGFIETLTDPDAGGDTAVRTRFLGIMEREARRLQSLVNDLLSMSRIEASKAEPPTASVDLAALVPSVIADLSAADAERGGDVQTDLIVDTPVVGDAGQLSQLLHNIIGNAMKYGARGTPIIVRTATAGAQMLALSVTDHGEGISAEQLPRITERFYRVDSARSRALGGTGLGLAIVKHIVERHRGRLDIESQQGVGTTITVRLPLSA